MKQNVCVFAVLLVLFSVTASELNEDQDEGELLVKPGKCLPSKQYLSCPSISLPNECILDVDCDGKKKCCFTGCTMLCAQPTQNKTFGKVCEVPVDLGFLIDSSESIGEKNFNKIKKMMHRALDIFTISEKKTRVGAVMIDSVPKVMLHFNTLKGDALNAENVGEILQRRVEFLQGKTRIDLALRMAYKELFTKAAGSRKHARKILLVFTDGGQTGSSVTMLNLTKSAQPLKKMGVHIFPVALWDHELNIATLLDIASDDRNLFSSEFYPELLSVLKKIAKVHCTGQAITMVHKDAPKALLLKKMKL